jgi:hypothetical protein
MSLRGAAYAQHERISYVADPTSAQLFLGLPAIVWTGVIGALTTLFGTLGAVVVTNWGNTTRLLRQLDHDSTEKGKERLATLRRELYLKAVDANVRGLAYFGTLPQADLTKPDIDLPLRDVLAAGAQLQLVVSQTTAQLVSDLISSYGELQLRLLAKVSPIHTVRSDIQMNDDLYERSQAEVKRVTASLTRAAESGQRDAEMFQRLERSYGFARDAAQGFADSRAEAWDKFIAMQREYLKDLVPEMKKLGEQQIHLLVELRRELDVGGDIDVFQSMMRRQMERAERAVTQFDPEVLSQASND